MISPKTPQRPDGTQVIKLESQALDRQQSSPHPRPRNPKDPRVQPPSWSCWGHQSQQHVGGSRAQSRAQSSTPATVSSQHNSEHFPPASQKSFCQPSFNCSLLRRSKQFPRKFRRLQKRPQTHETERLQVKSEHTGAKKQFSQDPFTLMEYQQLFMVSQTQDQTWLLPRVGGLWEYNTTREA